MATKEKQNKKNELRVIKEEFGDMPMEECFRLALEPYFDPDKELSLKRLR